MFFKTAVSTFICFDLEGSFEGAASDAVTDSQPPVPRIGAPVMRASTGPPVAAERRDEEPPFAEAPWAATMAEARQTTTTSVERQSVRGLRRSRMKCLARMLLP